MAPDRRTSHGYRGKYRWSVCGVNVLWHRPDKPGDVSVGRHCIAEALRDAGHDVDVRNADGGSFRAILTTNPDVGVGAAGSRRSSAAGRTVFTEPTRHLLYRLHLPVTAEHSPAYAWLIAELETAAFRLASDVMFRGE